MRALYFARLWVDLERYTELNSRIESRIDVLDPLISQLEKVAESGLGDVTQVAAAQRTVSKIRVRQTEVSDNFENAKLNFINSFGALPVKTSYDDDLVSVSCHPILESMAENVPAVRAAFFGDLSAEAVLAAIQAKKSINVGFETQITRPFGDSGYDSDESIGFVARKTFYVGETLNSEVKQAEANARNLHANVVSVLREGSRQIKSAQQTVDSMKMAI